MKVRDLMKKLLEVKDLDMLVFCTSNTGEYEYCIVNSARVSELRIDGVKYVDEDDTTDVFIIDEQ